MTVKSAEMAQKNYPINHRCPYINHRSFGNLCSNHGLMFVNWCFSSAAQYLRDVRQAKANLCA